MGQIKFSLSMHSPKVTSLLYKGLVHPKLEVATSIASPYFKKDIKVLEDVQRHATSEGI